MILNALLLAFLLAASQGFLKWAARQRATPSFTILSKRTLGIGISLGIYGVVMLLYIHVLRSQDITKLYPAYTGLAILLVMLMGILFFKEKPTKSQMLGCIMIIAGVYLIGK
jgi:multidrug transporter EmrE-like cation transporter